MNAGYLNRIDERNGHNMLKINRSGSGSKSVIAPEGRLNILAACETVKEILKQQDLLGFMKSNS